MKSKRQIRKQQQMSRRRQTETDSWNVIVSVRGDRSGDEEMLHGPLQQRLRHSEPAEVLQVLPRQLVRVREAAAVASHDGGLPLTPSSSASAVGSLLFLCTFLDFPSTSSSAFFSKIGLRRSVDGRVCPAVSTPHSSEARSISGGLAKKAPGGLTEVKEAAGSFWYGGRLLGSVSLEPWTGSGVPPAKVAE
ncbi:hypothetical protein EYF80_036731 [Liparis tanakae]|uniref:Uncharacterized protein n=1 Tax=Liparis tanakae TaxID=230148 RepID=A0A4Z2GHL0_9TELE|nr:hypothetical protein EYF80_036731 [Liparis tanakae]